MDLWMDAWTEGIDGWLSESMDEWIDGWRE